VLKLAHIVHGSLGGNSIGDAGARDLGAALQVNTMLTTLMWGYWHGLLVKTMWLAWLTSVYSLLANRIGQAGAQELFTSLQFNKTLERLAWDWDVGLQILVTYLVPALPGSAWKGWCFLYGFLSWAEKSYGYLKSSRLTDLARHRLARNRIPNALMADIDALLADPFRAALASGEADTKPAMHD
jgi:hypothetical protein